MGVKCRGEHRHVYLRSGRARAVAHYPAKLCRCLCKGMKRQARVDASGMLSAKILECYQDEAGDVTHVQRPGRGSGTTSLARSSNLSLRARHTKRS